MIELLEEPKPKEKEVEGKTLIVIPARMASKRLPGKPLLKAGGKALVEWTYERAKQVSPFVLVATPDREIGRYCEDRGIRWRPTRDDHPNGTSRCGEIMDQLKWREDIETVVNWQVDEPLVGAEDAERLVEDMLTANLAICTLVSKCCRRSDLDDQNTTKAAVEKGRAYWFSRAGMNGSFLHTGIYGFCRDALSLIHEINPSGLSRTESLEQLSWLICGYAVWTVMQEHFPLSINTPEDFEKFRRIVEENPE